MWEKIVLNLLSNAFKFTFEGEIAVALRAARAHGASSSSATPASGIPRAELPRLFERFHRVEGAAGRTHGGHRHRPRARAGAGQAARRHGAGGERPRARHDLHGDDPVGQLLTSPERIGRHADDGSTGSPAEAFVEEALRWLPGGGDPQEVRSKRN